MTRAPAFQFYPKQWLGDDQVLLMDWDARGMHLHLMCLAWQQDPPCTIPSDEAVLRKWCGNPKRWPKVKDQVLSAWKLTDGRYVQEGLLREYQKQAKYSESRRQSARARWPKDEDAGCIRIPYALHTEMRTDCFSSSSSIKKREEEADSLLPAENFTVEEVLAIWNHIPGAKTVQIQRLTPGGGLHRRITTLTANQGPKARTWWATVFEAVEVQRRFLLSGANDRNWAADLVWLLKPENLAKVLERRYEGLKPYRANGRNSSRPTEVVL